MAIPAVLCAGLVLACCLFTGPLPSDAQKIAARLDEALASGSICVYYQPVVDAQTGKIAAAEGLSRWKQEDGFLSPAVFIPALEETDRIDQLDTFIFSSVCRLQSQLLSEGQELFPVSVNVSGISARKPGKAAEYARILQDAGIPASAVRIEFTESTDLTGDELLQAVQLFRGEGFTIELDDFGSGYANFSCLTTASFDVLKIDKSITDGIGDKKGEIVLTAILDLAHSLDMVTIAEGAETLEQAEFLKAHGCDMIQGYYYSRPLPEEDFLAYLSAPSVP